MRNNSRQKWSHYKLILVSMMAAVYLLFSVGIVKATHFCMGREDSVAFFTSEAKSCPCALAEIASCCSDEQGLLKLEHSQKNFSFFQLSLPTLWVLREVYTRSLDAGEEVARAGVDASDPPPLLTSLYKLYCNYVFYGE